VKRSPPQNHYELHKLIHDAQLPRNEHGVLMALAYFADWETGDSILASIDSIADRARFKPRHTCTLLRRLEDRGLIESLGWEKGGRGKVRRRRIVIRRLMELADGAAETDWSESETKPCNRRRETLQSVRANYARSAHNQGDTKQRQPPPHASPASERANPKDIAIGSEEAAEVFALLRAEGVFASTARELSRRTTAAKVRLGRAMVESRGRTVRSREGMLVQLLRDGTVDHEFERQQRVQQHHERAAQLRKQASQIRHIIAATSRFKDSTEGEAILASLRTVRLVWSHDDAIAAAGVLSDDDLHDADVRPLELLKILERAATEILAARTGQGRWGSAERVAVRNAEARAPHNE